MSSPNAGPSFKDTDVALQTIPKGRSEAVARRALRRGQTILDGPATAVVPLPGTERCSRCLRAEVNVGCQGCGAEGYCSSACRDEALHEYHQRLCAALPRIHDQGRRRRWRPDVLANALLLAQLVARGEAAQEQVLDLLPAPGRDESTEGVADVVSEALGTSRERLSQLLDRFGNNNHQLETEALYPAGVAVLAKISRACNHSCTPSGVLVTHWREGIGLRVGVRVLRDLYEGEEITIPYLDPVQDLGKRRAALSKTYGFHCACARCTFQEANPSPRCLDVQDITSLQASASEINAGVFEVSPDGSRLLYLAVPLAYDTLSPALRGHIHPDNVGYVSQCVLALANRSAWESAARVSMYLCAIYVIIYGQTWPLLGNQLLATSSYYLNQHMSSSSRTAAVHLAMASSFAALAENCLSATVAEGGWLEVGSAAGGPHHSLAQIKAAILDEQRQQ